MSSAHAAVHHRTLKRLTDLTPAALDRDHSVGAGPPSKVAHEARIGRRSSERNRCHVSTGSFATVSMTVIQTEMTLWFR